MKALPGISRQAEEEKLKRTIAVAKAKVEASVQSVHALEAELHEMQEEFDESDKEMQALWHNADARFNYVRQELRIAEQARKKPYFGRIDFQDKKLGKKEVYYIGRSVIAQNPAEPEVIDWRAPIASVYYDANLGEVSYSVKGEGRYDITLSRKRTYEIEGDVLKDFYDSDVVANDELLTKYLAKNKRAVLGEIIATIQQEQNEVIRKKPQHNLIVQGAAGSGKTTVAMHRISYILYNYELEFAPEDFYIIGSNQVLLNYITSVLPELNVYGVCQMTMEQLFIRLLYEDWESDNCVKPVKRGKTEPIKGTYRWFHELEDFCERYERQVIPRKDVVLEKNGTLLLTKTAIERIWKQCGKLSRADKITKLTEHLMARLENEINGKYYSYTEDEKKHLMKYYSTYFGKREFKGSIYDLYDEFLREQEEKGRHVAPPGKEFDVYDLAALAYLYKRIKEHEIIREAGHVVIDEAQDFGMMAYGALKYCLSKCTYTIMGDVSQNISLDYGLNDWQELRSLMLPEEFDYFGLLQKSYRNTVEISHFATEILYHGNFQIYPVEPIVRHGNEVVVKGCESEEKLFEEAVSVLRTWQKAGMETIAVVCADEEEVDRVFKGLSGSVENLHCGENHLEFVQGVMVLSLEYTKGLEFDAVLIFDASREKYPLEDGYVKRLYVAATRALHELVVLHQGELTSLLGEAVSEEKKAAAVVRVEAPKQKSLPKEEEKTNEERYREQALEGENERNKRSQYGPKQIVITKNAAAGEKKEPNQRGETFDEPVGGKKSSKKGLSYDFEPVDGLNYSVSSYLERRQKELKKQNTVEDLGEFGEMPDNQKLRPAGHAKIDCSVRFSMKGSGYYDIMSNYGTLRIYPVSNEMFRICFAKGQCNKFPETVRELKGKEARCKIKETPAFLEFRNEKMLLRIEKRTGAISFLNAQEKLLFAEQSLLPRQVSNEQVWMFVDWEKKEELFARTPGDGKALQIGNSAKYLSYGKDNRALPSLVSSKGYELLFPPQKKVLCCRIPMYGSYLSMEETALLDFYIRAK